MIGWRVGWVTGAAPIIKDIGLVGLTNVVCQVGIAQQAVAAALADPGADADVAAATAVWRRRCEVVLDQLSGYPAVRPDGGWSLLIDTAARPEPGRRIPAAVASRQGGRDPHDGLGPERGAVPAPGVRQRAGRAAGRPACAL